MTAATPPLSAPAAPVAPAAPAAIVAVGVELAAAAAASALLVRCSPLPAGDAFHGTLAALPLLLAGFHAIARWCARAGGRRLTDGWSLAEVAALAGIVLLVLARCRLGLAHADEPLAGALALVLAGRVARQAAAARPLLGAALPDRPAAIFFFLPLAVYLAILPWTTAHRQPDGDEPFYLLVTHSLAYDFDADLTNNYARADWRRFMSRPIAPQPGDPVGADGERYSRHNALLPLALAPAYRLFGKDGALATMAAFAAALAWMTLRLARHYLRRRPAGALAAWALVAFAPPLLLYSDQVWVEVPAALLVALALDRLLALRPAAVPQPAPEADTDPAGGQRWGWREWLGFGLPVLLLPLLKIRLMLLAVPLLGLAWWRAGRRVRPVWTVAALLAAVAGGMLLYNELVYANPLKIHSWQELDLPGYSLGAYALGFSGLFYDAAFGLFSCAPIWLLLIPAALVLLARRGAPRALFAHLAILSTPYLLIVVPRAEWYGGWSPPFRYALVALPLLGISLMPVLGDIEEHRARPGGRALLAGLAALTLALALVWVVVPGWTFNVADGRTHLLDALAARLGSDLARFFPSSVRPRPATWIWPAATLVALPLLWWMPGRRGRGGSSATDGPAAALAGIAGLLVLAAALPLAATRVPTRTIELEDPQVVKSGGHLYPDRWVIERTRYRSGWTLRVGERLRAPVNPGGRRVSITVVTELVRNQPLPFSLDLLAGERPLATFSPQADRAWESVVLGPFDWPPGQPLVLAARGPRLPGPTNAAVLDRVRLDWTP